MTVDLDDLLEKGERFYKLYHDSLNFVTPGNSNVDSIRMMVIVHYTTTWTAYGGGYDDVIGALWVNPATMKPVGQTIAHEFGHSFQYQVYCDDPNKEAGFRQGQSGTSQDGNSFGRCVPSIWRGRISRFSRSGIVMYLFIWPIITADLCTNGCVTRLFI